MLCKYITPFRIPKGFWRSFQDPREISMRFSLALCSGSKRDLLKSYSGGQKYSGVLLKFWNSLQDPRRILEFHSGSQRDCMSPSAAEDESDRARSHQDLFAGRVYDSDSESKKMRSVSASQDQKNSRSSVAWMACPSNAAAQQGPHHCLPYRLHQAHGARGQLLYWTHMEGGMF